MSTERLSEHPYPIRLAPRHREAFQRAADLAGLSVASFIRSAALEKAQAVIRLADRPGE